MCRVNSRAGRNQGVVCRVGEHQHHWHINVHYVKISHIFKMYNGIWGSDIYGLNGLGIYDLNGWGIFDLHGWGIYGSNG